MSSVLYCHSNSKLEPSVCATEQLIPEQLLYCHSASTLVWFHLTTILRSGRRKTLVRGAPTRSSSVCLQRSNWSFFLSITHAFYRGIGEFLSNLISHSSVRCVKRFFVGPMFCQSKFRTTLIRVSERLLDLVRCLRGELGKDLSFLRPACDKQRN